MKIRDYPLTALWALGVLGAIVGVALGSQFVLMGAGMLLGAPMYFGQRQAPREAPEKPLLAAVIVPSSPPACQHPWEQREPVLVHETIGGPLVVVEWLCSACREVCPSPGGSTPGARRPGAIIVDRSLGLQHAEIEAPSRRPSHGAEHSTALITNPDDGEVLGQWCGTCERGWDVDVEEIRSHDGIVVRRIATPVHIPGIVERR